MNDLPSSNSRFPTTRWTIIGRLRSGDETLARRALDEICAQYRYPLYCYARRRDFNHHDAEDAVQDFLAKLLRNNSLEAANESKGDLRSYLSTALSHHLIDWRRSQRQQACSRIQLKGIRIPAGRYDSERFDDSDTPERIFDRQWARELLGRVMLNLGREYAAKGKKVLFDKLRPVLLDGGSLRGHDTLRLAAELGMKESSLRVALARMLADFRRLLEQEVLQTVESRADLDGEIRHLLRIFQPP